MHNFYSAELGKAGDEVSLPPAEVRHLFKTLRAAPGEVIGLLDGKGGSAQAEIGEKRKIILKNVIRQAEPGIKIHLFAASPKRAKMDQLLVQCTEAGVWAIHPVVSRYSVAVPERVNDRWKSLLREACKQSGNPFLPELFPPCSLNRALEMIKTAAMTAFYGAVKGNNERLRPALGSEVAWLVGPEGGFSAEEERQITGAGAFPLNLGQYVMRVETAAVCGTALLNFLSRERSF